MMAVDPSLVLALGIATILALAVERTAGIWLRAVTSLRVRAVALAATMWFPPVLVFSFLALIVTGSFPVETEPWFLMLPFLGALAVVYTEVGRYWGPVIEENREANRSDATNGRNDSVTPPSANDGQGSSTKETMNQTVPSGGASSAGAPTKGSASSPSPAATVAAKTEVQEASKGVATNAESEQPAQATELAHVREPHYSITKKGSELVELKPPQGRRGGGSLHVRMMKVLYYFYLDKGWYSYVDQGDDTQKMPDLLVHELKWIEKKLEDGTTKRMVDPYHWKEPPFHVEAETTPRKSKSQVIMNYEKAWALKRYVVFATPNKQDADDLQKIMDEINAQKDTYEIDNISDLLAEDLAHPELTGPMEVAP